MRRLNSKGFTLIEILMVLILIAVLAAVGINSFVNFRNEAKDAALRSNLAALRAGITAQYAQMQLRCGKLSTDFPPQESLALNDITDGTDSKKCDPAVIPSDNEKKFVQGGIPDNPWASSSAADPKAVGACVTCDRSGPCDGASYSEAWCYNELTGEIWADIDPASTTPANDRKNW